MYLHGYNINTQQARGEHSSVFKRLYQMGLQSSFTGVTWFGWESQTKILGEYKCPKYYNNIINAFKTSAELKSVLDRKGYANFAIGGHSMGNVVISSAIADWGLSPAEYLLFNAAVATEAFDTGSIDSDTKDKMKALSWEGYHERMWASEWHHLFTDERTEITWKNRFGDMNGKAFNFFSSSENVLKNSTGAGVTLFPFDFFTLWNGELAWYAQEVGKGGDLARLAGTDEHGGWGFQSANDYRDYYAPGSVPCPDEGWQTWKPEKANQIGTTPLDPADATELSGEAGLELLRNAPFFGEFDESDGTFASPYDRDVSGGQSFAFEGGDFYGADGAAAANNLPEHEFYMAQAKVLAEAIPAVSYATGANPVGKFNNFGERNFDMPALFRDQVNNVPVWPIERVRDNDFRWKHGDMHRVSLVYLYKLFDRIVQTGNL